VTVKTGSVPFPGQYCFGLHYLPGRPGVAMLHKATRTAGIGDGRTRSQDWSPMWSTREAAEDAAREQKLVLERCRRCGA
jgi:hypothetical protein